MPTHYTGRVLLILGVLLVSLASIFPLGSLFDPNLTLGQKLGLKPGIDMVGGVSLLYEIKPPEGGGPATIQNEQVINQVMESLKKRVDPNGVMNLIWRPQGANRLEIQMPTSKTAESNKAARDAFGKAQEALENTNVRSAEVLRAVEKLTGDQRRNRLNDLAMGSEPRAKLFGALASTFDQIQDAKKKQDAAKQAELEIQYDNLKKQIDDTNLPASALEATLGLPQQPERDKKLADLKVRNAGFDARLKAIDNFAKAYGEYAKVKGTLDDAADLKRLLRGSGVLEFHILPQFDATAPMQALPPDIAEMVQRLKTRGPVVQARDTMRWFAVDQPEEFRSQTVLDPSGKPYVLAYITGDKSLDQRPGRPPWALEKASPLFDPNSTERKVGFTFDPQGAKYFGDLSGANIGKPLGIVLDDRMISAPTLN